MKISVIITAFNLEQYIKEAIQSVLNQKFDLSHVEIIVVDDCSTDNTPAIIKSFGNSLKYIRLSANKGVLLATIEGINASTGDILCFLDGDDVWKENKLALVTAYFEKINNLSFLSHNYEYIDDRGMPFKKKDSSQKQLLMMTNGEEISDYMRQGILEYQGVVWLGSAYSIRRNSIKWENYFEYVNKLPDPKMTYQDWLIAFWIATDSKAYFGYCPETLMSYRVHDRNYSGDASTIEKMMRNLRKSLNTRVATYDIVKIKRFPLTNEKIIETKIKENEYLIALYQYKILSAVKLFPRCAYYIWPVKTILKEAMRLLGVAFLGPKLFLRLTK